MTGLFFRPHIIECYGSISNFVDLEHGLLSRLLWMLAYVMEICELNTDFFSEFCAGKTALLDVRFKVHGWKYKIFYYICQGKKLSIWTFKR